MLAASVYARFVGDYFQGGDTWPHIWTAQVSSASDLLRDLSRPIMYGTVFPDTVALFFRPLSTLSYALDYAIWGMSPVAFHATDLAIHVAATLALFALCTMVGLRRWPAAIGAAAFTLHPIAVTVVPDLPRRHDSLAAAGVFGALALAAWAVRLPAGDRRVVAAVVGAGVLLGLGETAKESAFVGVLLAPPTLIAGLLASGCWPGSRWPRVAAATVLFSLISGVVLLWRFAVLGGVGGYYDQVPPLDRLDIGLTNLLQNLLWPVRGLLGRTPRAWLTEIFIALALTGMAAAFGRRGTRIAILHGWLWLVLGAIAQLLTKSVAAWQSYLTIGGLAFLVGGVVQAVLDEGGAWRSIRRAGFARRATLLVSLLGVAAFEVVSLRQSALFSTWEDWHIAGEIGRQYLASIRPCLDATPPGMPVMLNQYPGGLDDSTDERKFAAPGILGPYSLAPAVYLTIHPPPPVIQDSRLQMVLQGMPRGMTSVCHEEGGAWWIRTDYVQ